MRPGCDTLPQAAALPESAPGGRVQCALSLIYASRFVSPAARPAVAPPSPALDRRLERLVALRRVTLLCQGGVLLLAVSWLRIPLAVLPMLSAIVLLALVNLATQWRLGEAFPWPRPVQDAEVAGQLSLDVLVLTLLLYYAGGSANPFVSLLLLPPTLAAVALPSRLAWALAVLAVFAYGFLMFWNLPLPPPQGELAALDALLARAAGGSAAHAEHVSGFALHVLGMAMNFLISVAVVVYFLTRSAAALRERERELAGAREAALRNEQILALGTMAAGAAHQLGTPLSTLAVVIRDLSLDHAHDPGLQEDLTLLRTQVDECKRILTQTLTSAGQVREGAAVQIALDAYLERLIEDWQLIRPGVSLQVMLAGPRPGPAIAADRTLEQALLNLLDNAADASTEVIEFAARWDAQQCCIEIRDRGPGVDALTMQHLGRPLLSAKRELRDHQGAGGMGIGFFLSNATLERFGGRVEIENRIGGGALVRVCLPLARLQNGDAHG